MSDRAAVGNSWHSQGKYAPRNPGTVGPSGFWESADLGWLSLRDVTTISPSKKVVENSAEWTKLLFRFWSFRAVALNPVGPN